MIEQPLWNRLLVGFLVSPIVPGVLTLLLGAVLGSKASEAIWLLVLSAVIAYPATVVLGIPAFFVLRRFGLNGVGHYLLAGAFLGALVFVFLAPSHVQTTYFFQNGWTFLSVAVGAAAIASGAFWLIARPDIKTN